MKLLTLILFTTILHVSASTFGQKISLNEKQASIEKIFDQISAQTGYDFLVSRSMLEKARPVSINAKNQDLSQVLETIFKDQPLNYEIKNNSVIVSRKTPSFLDRVVIHFTAIDIHGTIRDEQGQPLAGATIKVKGSNKTTVSDGDGNFLLNQVEDDAILQIQYLGYEPQEIKAAKALTITLKQATADLQEVTINKGYYRTTMELNTGNVGVLKAEEIAKQPVSDPLQALSGRIPGLYIQENRGAPGRAINVRIRGRNSLANGISPLYIVDGIAYGSTPLNTGTFSGGAGGFASPLNDLPTADIESIEVLKDADATAIYGSRGANGVILITTKRGEAGKSKVTFNLSTGRGNATKLVEMMNTEQYLAMRREAFRNDSQNPNANDHDLNGNWDESSYTDWPKLLLGGTANLYDFQSSISSGTTKLNYRLGGQFRKETTIFPGNFFGQKGAISLALNHLSEDKKLQLQFKGNYVSNLNRLPSAELASLVRQAPNSPSIFDENGNLNWANNTWDNPMSFLFRTNDERTNNLISNLNLSYEILPGLTLKTNTGFNESRMDQVNIRTSRSVNTALTPDLNLSRLSYFVNSKNTTWVAEPDLSFTKMIGPGTLDL